MSQWQSSQPPTAEQLLSNVRQLVNQPKFQSLSGRRDPYDDTTVQYTEIIDSLSDMLSQFPQATVSASPKELKLPVEIAYLSLDAIERVSYRMEGALVGQERNCTWKLLSCIAILDRWDQKNTRVFQEFKSLRTKVMEGLARVYQIRKGESFTLETKQSDGLVVINSCLDSALELLGEIITQDQMEFPWINSIPGEPRSVQVTPQKSSNPFQIIIHDQSHAHIFAASLSQALARIMAACGPMSFTNARHLRKAIDLTNKLGKISLPTFDPETVLVLSRLLDAIEQLAQLSDDTLKLMQPALVSLLLGTMSHPNQPEWEPILTVLRPLLDKALQKRSLSFEAVDKSHIRDLIIAGEVTSPSESTRALVFTYLSRYCSRCPRSVLEEMERLCHNHMEVPEVDHLREIVHQRLNTPVPRVDNPLSVDWETESEKQIRSLFDMEPYHGMDIDGNQWQTHILAGVDELFSRDLPDKTVAGRLRLARAMLQLPSLLVSPQERDSDKRTEHALINLYGTALAQLTQGTDAEVTAEIWRISYAAFLEAINRGKVEEKDIEQVEMRVAIPAFSLGLEHKNRPVRLAAGRALAAYYKYYQGRDDTAILRTQIIAGYLEGLVQTQSTHIVETTICTLGWIAEFADPAALSTALFPLICVLGHQNPVIRGTAFQQLARLSKRSKSPYSLVAPDISRIGFHIASHCVQNPALMGEFCRFISYPPSSLFSQTLTSFLPHLVANCRAEELATITKLMDTNLAALIIDKPAEVLEEVFMLKETRAMENALEFIVRNLNNRNNLTQTKLGIASLVRSKLSTLLGRLVIRFGNATPEDDKAILKAIERTEKYSTSEAKRTPSRPGSFLQQHIMAIVTHLNNELQDVHGKRSVDTKQWVLYGLRRVMMLIGESIAVVAPQLVAIMQNTIRIAGLTSVTVEVWQEFASIMSISDFGPYVPLTSAIFVASWHLFDRQAKSAARGVLLHILEHADALSEHLESLASFKSVHDLHDISSQLSRVLSSPPLTSQLYILAKRIADMNPSISYLGVLEARQVVSDYSRFLPLVTGDSFDPSVGALIKSLHLLAGREGDVYDEARQVAYETIGVIGAVDPDRFSIPSDPPNYLATFCDFQDEKSAQEFAAYLISEVLAPIFPKTSDIRFQNLLAYTLQELLAFCGFSELAMSRDGTSTIPAKTRHRWSNLPNDVRAMVAPLLSSRFTIEGSLEVPTVYPIYPSISTYKEWIQKFASYLISRVDSGFAGQIFQPFRSLLGSADVQVILSVLPHLVVEVLGRGDVTDFNNIHGEIIAVLQDQLTQSSGHSSEMKLLCAQTVFHLMDHLNRYLRVTALLLGQNRKQRGTSIIENRKLVEFLTTRIDHGLMAQAAFTCKQYARALMSLEQRVLKARPDHSQSDEVLQSDYEKMHEIYAKLDEPDGMNGISTSVLIPTLEHQIREHESNGRWTSAQSCWEVSLQQNPNNLTSQIGLLRCLRNLGHYDTLRTHLDGIMTRNPEWHTAVESFRLEGAWTAHDWGSVEKLVNASTQSSPELTMARILLALRGRDSRTIAEAMTQARSEFGQPIGSSGPYSYRRSYEASLSLHIVEELGMISKVMAEISVNHHSGRTQKLTALSRLLDTRYQSVLPSYRTLEPILNIRRTAFDLLNKDIQSVDSIVGQYWLVSSKIARKAGHFQASYSALLQGRQRDAPYHFVQSCKLLESGGESIRALQELNNALMNPNQVIDLTEDDDVKSRAKAWLLRAKWMQASERFSRPELNAQFSQAATIDTQSEAVFFYWALYLDRSQKHKEIPSDHLEEYVNHIDHVVRNYGKSLQFGSKHLYQTVPRLLTLWLNLGQRPELKVNKGMSTADHPHRAALSKYGRLCEWMKNDLIKNVDPFKWLTAFPQIVSRIVVESAMLKTSLYAILGKVVQEFPQQSLWIISGVQASAKKERAEAASRALGFSFNTRFIPETLTSDERVRILALIKRVQPLIATYSRLNAELLHLCNFDVENLSQHQLHIKCPELARMDLRHVIVPLQDSFTTKIPPMSSILSQHQPFPTSLPTIRGFSDIIKVMPSLQRPRKIGVVGSNGEEFNFLCKPKDDLRKDARLMDFNAVVNKLLRANSDSRRRQLHIRTYSVVPLNEECGLIEWVRNTSPFRELLKPRYDALGVGFSSKKVQEYFDRFKQMTPEAAAAAFKAKILPEFPPVFHEWFLETFPEPTAWFTSRLAYCRTAAVISMVGYIIGLGDRHCENIMFDTVTGETVHCDFNCIFEKGKQLEVPELVPFRLTQNIVSAMGITGVEGCFRISCEITMKLLRSNQDCLMSVLEAFIHDPLVEWEHERRRKERHRSSNTNRPVVDLKTLAAGALEPIERKLQGLEGETQISVSNQVEKLIQDATSLLKLSKMYVGWSPWM